MLYSGRFVPAKRSSRELWRREVRGIASLSQARRPAFLDTAVLSEVSRKLVLLIGAKSIARPCPASAVALLDCSAPFLEQSSRCAAAFEPQIVFVLSQSRVKMVVNDVNRDHLRRPLNLRPVPFIVQQSSINHQPYMSSEITIVLILVSVG